MDKYPYLKTPAFPVHQELLDSSTLISYLEKMFIPLTLVILLSATLVSATPTLVSTCTDAEEIATSYTKWISTNFNKGDVSGTVNILKSLVKRCGLDPKRVGVGSELSYKAWENSGFEAELSLTRDRIARASNYREVDKDIEEYKMWADKLHKNPRTTEKYIATQLAEYRRQGIISKEHEIKSCQPAVDLRNPILGPVRDQDSIGWCYAFAAADLLTNKLGVQVSAADIAINNNNTWFNSLFKIPGAAEHEQEGGIMKDAIQATKDKGGACLESNFRSEDNGSSSLKSTLATIDSAKRKSTVLSSASPSSSFNCYPSAKILFPNLQLADFITISEKATHSELVKSLSDKACGSRKNINQFRIKSEITFSNDGKKKLFSLIDEQLEKKNIVGIGYNASILYDINSYEQSNHGSVIVGRKFNSKKGECEYLIRNSWGRGCSSYDPLLSCEEGHIWVPKSVLTNSRALNATYLD